MEAELWTRRLWIRPILPVDAKVVARALSHPDVTRYYGVSFDNIRQALAQMDWFRQLERQHQGRWWGLIDPSSGRMVGAAGIHDYDARHARAEIGGWMLPEHQGKGLMQEAWKDALLPHLKQVWSMHRLEAWIDRRNRSSSKLIARMGFVLEGCRRNCEWRDGQWIDLEMWAYVYPD